MANSKGDRRRDGLDVHYLTESLRDFMNVGAMVTYEIDHSVTHHLHISVLGLTMRLKAFLRLL